MTRPCARVLLTGASGFVGSHAAPALARQGFAVRALVRATSDVAHLEAAGVELVPGDVTDAASVARAVAGADVALHLAGLVAARSDAEFARVNVHGARVVAAACAAAGVARLVLVSSLAARGPDGGPGPVSSYGRSKRAGEEAAASALRGSRTALVVVRPTVVYGPRDRALLPVFRLAKLGLRVVLRGGGALTVVHAADLAAGLAGLAGADPPVEAGAVLEVSDGRTYAWEDLVGEAARAVGKPGAVWRPPAGLVAVAARITDLVARVTGVPQVFGREKLAEMRGSWTVAGRAFWEAAGVSPRFDFPAGAADTVAAYREAGWL